MSKTSKSARTKAASARPKVAGIKTIDPQAEIDAATALVVGKVMPAIRAGVGKSKAISGPAERFWIDHYTRTFFFAAVALDRPWAADEPQVLAQATLVGRMAALVSVGQTAIERSHARTASGLIDCGDWRGSTPSGGIKIFYKWC